MVDDPQSSIESFSSQFKLSRKEAQAAQEAWDLEPGYNLSYVMNAFTRGAQDSTLTAEESFRLERVAGMVLDMSKEGSIAGTA